jgi:hypothetical protein
MAELIEIPVGDSSVLVEITGAARGHAVPMGADDQAAHRVEQSIETSLEIITKLAGAFSSTLKKTGAKSAEISLGLKFTAKGSLFIAESSAEATLGLKLSFA